MLRLFAVPMMVAGMLVTFSSFTSIEKGKDKS
ncbi:MAG: hypothetical protein RIR96_1415, partial [Bacteroidota bacterium]